MQVRGKFSVVGVIFVVAAAISPLLGQEARGRVQGIVTDPSQAAVAGAKVTLSNVKTGIENVKPTDATGLYRFDFVIPGIYKVTVEAAGFNKFVQENIEVQTAGDVTVNAALKLGDVAQTVTVSETGAEIQSN